MRKWLGRTGTFPMESLSSAQAHPRLWELSTMALPWEGQDRSGLDIKHSDFSGVRGHLRGWLSVLLVSRVLTGLSMLQMPQVTWSKAACGDSRETFP